VCAQGNRQFVRAGALVLRAGDIAVPLVNDRLVAIGSEAARQVVAGLALLIAGGNLLTEPAQIGDRAFELGRRTCPLASRLVMADTQLLTGHRSRHCGIGPIDCIERGVTTPEQNCQCETDAVPVIHI